MRAVIGPSVSLWFTATALTASLAAVLSGALPAGATEQRPPPVAVSGGPTAPPASGWEPTTTTTPATSTTIEPYRPVRPSDVLDTPLQPRPTTVPGPGLEGVGLRADATPDVPAGGEVTSGGDSHADGGSAPFATGSRGLPSTPVTPAAPDRAAAVGSPAAARAAGGGTGAVAFAERSTAEVGIAAAPAGRRPGAPVAGSADRMAATGMAAAFAALLAGAGGLVLWRSRPRRQEASAT